MRRNFWPGKLYPLLFFVSTVSITSAFCQSAPPSTHTQYLYWLRYQNQLQFSSALSLNNEIDNRRFFDPDVANQLIIHSRLHYRRGRWDHAAGLTASWIFTQLPEKGYDHSTLELRPVIETNYEIPFKKWSLQQRLRLDNRFFEANEDESIFQHSTYVLRIRYRLQARIPISKEGSRPMNLRFADEIMINDRKNTFDQNRIYVNYDIAISHSFTLDLGYIYIYQQRFGQESFFERHVVRFSVLHRIKCY